MEKIEIGILVALLGAILIIIPAFASCGIQTESGCLVINKDKYVCSVPSMSCCGGKCSNLTYVAEQMAEMDHLTEQRKLWFKSYVENSTGNIDNTPLPAYITLRNATIDNINKSINTQSILSFTSS